MPDKDAIDALRAQIKAIEGSSAPSYGGCSEDGAAAGVVNLLDPPLECASEQTTVDTSSDAKAFSKIVALINASDKSELAVRERLARDGFPEAEIESAIGRAKDYSIIDDARFAEVLVRSRRSQGKGLAGIKRELLRNGIEADNLDFWHELDDVEADGELERALDLLRRKPPRSKNLRDGAYRKLVQKGYSASVASRAAREWLESQEPRGFNG